MLGETNCDSEIGGDRILGIVFARISIEPGGKIDREDECIFFPSQPIDLAGGGADRFAQKRFCAGAEQAVENDGLRRAFDRFNRLGLRVAQRFQFFLR